jgi:hypothetical protein
LCVRVWWLVIVVVAELKIVGDGNSVCKKSANTKVVRRFRYLYLQHILCVHPHDGRNVTKLMELI